MWSDGVVTSFGQLVSNEGATLKVKNPVIIMFQVINEPEFEIDETGHVKVDEHGNPSYVLDENGQPKVKGGLKWDMNPYVFGACLKDSADNIWTVTPTNIISEDAEFDERLIGHYSTLIRLCGSVDEQ